MENTPDNFEEDESAKNYNLWMTNKITDKEYFRAVNRSK